MNNVRYVTAKEVWAGMYIETQDANGEWVFKQVTRCYLFSQVSVFIEVDGDATVVPSDTMFVVADTDPTGTVTPRHDVPEWDEYFLGAADAIAARAKCRRRKVGAVIVGQDRRILATGYNGAPSGMPDCLQGACPRGLTSYGSVEARSPYDDPTSPGYCPAIHGEANALLFAGRDVRGATIYVTDAPCPNCTKLLAGAGIERAVWRTETGWADGSPKLMLAARKIEPDNPNRQTTA